MSGISTAVGASVMSGPTRASAPSAPASSVTASSQTPAAQGVSVGMTQETRQFVIRLFAVAIVVFTGAILTMLIYRAWMDGNAPLTAQITADLVGLIPWLLGFVAAIITGEPVGTALVAYAMRIFIPGGSSLPTSLPALPGLPASSDTTTTTATTTATPPNG